MYSTNTYKILYKYPMKQENQHRAIFHLSLPRPNLVIIIIIITVTMQLPASFEYPWFISSGWLVSQKPFHRHHENGEWNT